MVPGSFVVPLNSRPQVIQIVMLDLKKLGRFCCIQKYFTKRTADGSGVLIFVRSNRSTDMMVLKLIIALLADDVREGG